MRPIYLRTDNGWDPLTSGQTMDGTHLPPERYWMGPTYLRTDTGWDPLTCGQMGWRGGGGEPHPLLHCHHHCDSTLRGMSSGGCFGYRHVRCQVAPGEIQAGTEISGGACVCVCVCWGVGVGGIHRMLHCHHRDDSALKSCVHGSGQCYNQHSTVTTTVILQSDGRGLGHHLRTRAACETGIMCIIVLP